MYRGADTTITVPKLGQIPATKKLRGCDRKDGAKSMALAGKYTSCLNFFSMVQVQWCNWVSPFRFQTAMEQHSHLILCYLEQSKKQLEKSNLSPPKIKRKLN